MSTDVNLPKLGVEMESARLQEWVVAEGDAVAADQVIATVETEKVVFELEAPAAGRLHIVAAVDEEYAIGDHLGAIAATDEEYEQLLAGAAAPVPAAAAAASAAAEPSPLTPTATSEALLNLPALAPDPPPATGPALGAGPATNGHGRLLATPVARRMARAHGLDLALIGGSGRGGVVRRRDVERAIEAGESAAAATAPATPAAAPPVAPVAPADAPSTVVALSSMRRTIASRMHASMQGTAQMTDIRELDVTDLVAFRRRIVAREAELGFKLSFTTLFARAAIIALQQVPEMNAALESETELRRFESVNLGMAVAIPDGLIVPVVHGAERLSMRALNEELVAVIGRARDRTASARDLSGGTFTITNFGSFGSHMGTPILMPPQVGILGIGALLDRPVVRDGELAVGKVMYACLTVDHRVIDGEVAGRFLNVIERLVADPELLLLG